MAPDIIGARKDRTEMKPVENTCLRVCSKITSDFGGSAAWPDARTRGASARAPGASPPVGCDRRATKQMARRCPAPEGWGCLAVWRCCSLLTDPWRVCASLAPSQTAKQPPAKSEFIFEQTLSRRAPVLPDTSPAHDERALRRDCRGGNLFAPGAGRASRGDLFPSARADRRRTGRNFHHPPAPAALGGADFFRHPHSTRPRPGHNGDRKNLACGGDHQFRRPSPRHGAEKGDLREIEHR